MSDPFRPSVRSAVTDFSRSLGTLVALVWVLLVASVALGRAVDVSMAGETVRIELFWLAVVAIAGVGAVWLVDGGYDRLGADPAGVWSFVWLSIVVVPLAFVPLRIAIGFLTPAASLLDTAFVLGTTLAAGWLAFYGGLERLSLALEDFLRVFGFVLALGSVPTVAVLAFDAAWVIDPHVGASLAVAVQVAACWLGFARVGG